jgi:3-oxoacyl-[acyl-carrier protein] reductase
LSGKNYLIVGGSSGIGLSLTELLASTGNHVTVVSRNQNNLIEKMFGARQIISDATTENFINQLDEELDGVVYCPGSINLKPFHRLTEADFLSDFNINVIGAVKTIQACLPLLKKGRNPSIVLFSTVAVAQGMPFHSSIAASKGAIEGLAKSLAAELSPTIRVNVIAPSLTNTPLANKLLGSQEKIEAAGNRHPLKKIGTPEDIANLASFLLSEQASWITGQIFGVDGGLSTLRVN